MKVKVLNLDGSAAKGEVELSDAVFGIEPRADILHRVVTYQQQQQHSRAIQIAINNNLNFLFEAKRMEHFRSELHWASHNIVPHHNSINTIPKPTNMKRQ